MFGIVMVLIVTLLRFWGVMLLD